MKIQERRNASKYQRMQIGNMKGRAQQTIHRACQQELGCLLVSLQLKGGISSAEGGREAAVIDTATLSLLSVQLNFCCCGSNLEKTLTA